MENNKLPEGWEVEKLDDLAIISAGQGAPQKGSDYGDEGYPFIKVSNLEFLCTGGSEREIPKINDSIAAEKKLRLYDRGTIIFAKSGMSCMKERVYAINEPCYIVNHLACINPEGINSKYLMYFFKKNPPTRLIKDMSYPSIRLSDIAEMGIIVPPLETQEKIVEVLEKAEKALEKRKEANKLLDELVKSRFIELFGDPVINPKNYNVVRFDEVVDYMGDIGSNGANSKISSNLKMSDTEDYALMVRTLNFTANNFEKNVKYISKEAYDVFKKSKIFGGELIFNKIGSAGINFIMPYLNRPVSLGLNQIMVRTNEKVNIIFLYALLNTDYGKYQINRRTQGAVTKSITKGAIKEIPLILPPIELQIEFADFVKQVDKLKFEMQKSLEELENNYQSLMQRAFKGELVN